MLLPSIGLVTKMGTDPLNKLWTALFLGVLKILDVLGKQKMCFTVE